MATPTRKSPSTKNATSPGKNDVRLLQRIRVLKEKCNKLEIERDEAESREQRLRDTLFQALWKNLQALIAIANPFGGRN